MSQWTADNLPLFNKVLLELQSLCNRSCFFCPRTGDASGKRFDSTGTAVRQGMPTEHALAIMDQLAALGYHGWIAFHHLSEPFLDPRILDMARAARQRGLRPYEHTNGDVLRRRPDLCEQVVKLFDYVCVGLYDYTTPAELEADKAFWRARLPGIPVLFSEVGAVYPRSFVSFDERMVRTQQTYPCGACSRPLERLLVHYDGSVGLCCDDMHAEFGLGNAFAQPIRDIWFSERHVDLINALSAGQRRQFRLCRECPLPPTQRVVPLPSVSGLEFQALRFEGEEARFRDPRVGGARLVRVFPEGEGVACEVAAGEDSEDRHYGGIRFPTTQPAALRFEMGFANPAAVEGVWVDGLDAKRTRVWRWQWRPTRTRRLPEEPVQILLVPGEPAGEFAPILSADGAAVCEVKVFIRVRAGDRAGFVITSMETGRPADVRRTVENVG